jgi:hypothetical protein
LSERPRLPPAPTPTKPFPDVLQFVRFQGRDPCPISGADVAGLLGMPPAGGERSPHKRGRARQGGAEPSGWGAG